MITTITREICKVGILRINVMVFLSKHDNGEYAKFKPRKSFKRFIGQQGVSLTYDFPTFLMFDYTMCSGSFVKEHKMFIPIPQVTKVISFLKKTLAVVDDPEGRLYYLDADNGNKLSMYHLSAEDIKRVVITESGFSGNHRLRSYPTIVKDYQENLYEGSVICFDRRENTVQLAYDELRALLYILSKTDFVTLSQSMVNSTLIWTDREITKHLDIETVKSTDYRQKLDLNESAEKREQPKPMYGNNVFSGLATGGNEDDQNQSN